MLLRIAALKISETSEENAHSEDQAEINKVAGWEHWKWKTEEPHMESFSVEFLQFLSTFEQMLPLFPENYKDKLFW